jgi:molybdopterin-synthase adenylyltransferase
MRINQNNDLMSRNHLLLGSKGQEIVSSLKVVVIGTGGLGWHVAPQLVGVGVRFLTLIDPDILELSNLNRLPGAPYKQVGKPKVKVLANLLNRMSPELKIKPLFISIEEKKALNVVKQCDFLFGGVDSDSPRFSINKLSVRYLKPYIDGGSQILLKKNNVKHMGGQVNVVQPGVTPCLACHNMLDQKMIAFESLNDQEKADEIRGGYIKGVDEKSPSVVSLNGIIASSMVNEFIALATGLKKPNAYLYYDYMLENQPLMFPIKSSIDPDCVICHRDAYFASGDLISDTKPESLPSFLTEVQNG